MKSETVSIQLKEEEVSGFSEYSITSDIFVADDQFSFVLGDWRTKVENGEKVVVTVDGERVLVGILDRVERSFSKTEGRVLSLSGRSSMAHLVDNYVTKFRSLRGKLEDIANDLLTDVRSLPYFGDQFKEIEFQPGTKRLNIEEGQRIEPGMTIFDALDTAARARGLIFFDRPDGSFVFGKPKENGETKFTLNITERDGCDVIDGRSSVDISGLYSKLVVIGQIEGEVRAANVQYTLEEYAVLPFLKTMVIERNSTFDSPKETARAAMEKQMASSFELSYTVPGHTQNGRPWAINELVDVNDEILGIRGAFLVYARTFKRGSGGTTTELRLGPPGIIL